MVLSINYIIFVQYLQFEQLKFVRFHQYCNRTSGRTDIWVGQSWVTFEVETSDVQNAKRFGLKAL